MILGRPNRHWRLTTLADYWQVITWMEQQRQAGRASEALATFYRHMTARMVEGVEQYQEAAHRVDQLSGGLYSAADSAEKAHMKLPGSMSVLTYLDRMADELRDWLASLTAMDDAALARQWDTILAHQRDYIKILSRLVAQFGNFEALVMLLPGVDPRITDAAMQEALTTMYRINTRHIRMLELISDVRKAWGRHQAATGFFEPQADLARLVQQMIGEYMLEGDPVRINAARAKAKAAGRPYSRYRFWRPAETFRQLAAVTYDQTAKRRPRPTRQFVDLKLQPAPPLCVDLQRLEWSIKEVFNNAIAATSHTTLQQGMMHCKPLDKHRAGKSPAIQITVDQQVQRRWFFRKVQTLRLIIEDYGIGMCPELTAHAPLWAYSTRRAGVDNQLRPASGDGADAEMIIGGKGIGLAFATATIRELGGNLAIESTVDQGTRVTMTIPWPSPHAK